MIAIRPDSAEWRGTGVSLGLHIALIAALSLSLARLPGPAEPPAISVEFVDEIGLQSTAQVLESAPAQQAVSPEPALEDAPLPPDEAVPEPPRADPTPAPPRESSTPSTRPREEARPSRPRRSRLGDDFLDGIAEGNARTGTAESGQAAAPVIDAVAMASIQQAIRRQIQPCADRQVDPGPGANQIRVTLNLRLTRSGRLARPPRVVRTAGVTPSNERYEQRVRDLAVAAYTGCAPLTGLPSELYRTAEGGWSNINMTYRLP